MSSLPWNSANHIGVKAIDDQHGILLDSLNELRVALLHGADAKSVATMVRRVANLMRLHIDSEERLLALHGFPGLAAHKSESERLLGRLEQFEVRYEQRQSSEAFALVEYLRKWFTSHTGASGRAYGPWLHKCGVQ
jgi:hemerythrin-like metal-binding protein